MTCITMSIKNAMLYTNVIRRFLPIEPFLKDSFIKAGTGIA